jgi:uncharacterized repeat protein (TIGR03806 family)
MRCLYFIFLITLSLVLSMAFVSSNGAKLPYPEKLSDWGFFEGELKALKTGKNVIPYQLTTALFSDYSHKARFLYLPANKKVNYHPTEVLDYPEGSVLIKNFYYPKDFRKPEQDWQIIETRLLIHETEGWEAISYIWSEDMQEAYLDLAGGSRMIRWRDEKGKRHKLEYLIPNKNQCKGCHNFNTQIQPIGPSARQLNSELEYPDGQLRNQLKYWASEGLLAELPQEESSWPKIAHWDDPAYALEDRARAWLDINCAHCHRKEGPASTSGLYLGIHETDPTALGIYKTPIAAGRGSGGHQFDILPGNAQKSILVYRMKSDDPGIMMPEIARQLVHKEGLQLIEDWVNQLDPADFQD